MKKLLFIVLVHLFVNVFAQNKLKVVNRKLPTCGATHQEDLIRQLHPELNNKQKALDDKIRDIVYGNQGTQGSKAAPPVYTIPVVVHVVHFTGTAIGTAENISDAQVIQGIQDLNDSYRNVGFYNPATGADCEIEFCLASQDPSGSFTTGITRTANNALTDLDSDTEDATLKSTIAQWDPTSYCNIWLVDEICSSGSGSCGTAGYAYLASSHGQPWDGIVNEAAFFGSSQNNSKVHIHEMGHYLNLSHTFAGGCTNNDCTSDGDQVCDTPPDNSTAAISCASTTNTCNTDEDDTSANNPFRPIGMGGLGAQNDMIENYMDYGFQSCQDRFTTGQSSRMRTAITGARSSLLSSVGCIDPSSPEVYFTTTAVTVNEEGTAGSGGCNSYTDVTVTMSIAAAPTGDADITIIYAGTATGGAVDYTAGTAPEITFPDAGTADQTFTIRIWDDVAIEGDETITLTYTIGGTTDAVSASFSQEMTITITDNDNLPTTAGRSYLLNEDFSGGIPGTWSQTFFGCPCFGSDLVWNTGTAGLTGTSAYISEDGGTTRADNLNDARALALVTESIDATSVTDQMTFKFDLDIGGDAVNDYLEVYYNIGGWWIWLGPIHSYSGAYSIDLPMGTFNGNSFQFGFIWNSNGDGAMVGDVPAIDNVQVFIDGQPSQVESSLSSVDAPFGPFETVYIYNGEDNEIVARLTNLSAWDYGCTTFEIDRTGTSALQFNSQNVANYATEKTLLITPTNNNAAGNYEIRLYYTDAEVSGWEGVTSNARANLVPFKCQNSITAKGTGTFGTSETNGTYNTTEFYTQAEFSTGFSGFASMVSGGSLLPIDLQGFNAEKDGNNALISWYAANAKDFEKFEIERSSKTSDFGTIGTINYLENQKNYHFVDDAPLKGANYYRLKMVDLDGTKSYSEVKKLEFNDTKIKLFPNPFDDGIKILGVEGNANVQVLDLSGKVVLSTSISNGNESLELTGLPNGSYVIHIQTEVDSFVERIVKTTK